MLPATAIVKPDDQKEKARRRLACWARVPSLSSSDEVPMKLGIASDATLLTALLPCPPAAALALRR